MKLIAIDSTGNTASVAVADDTRMIGELTVNHKKTHAETLLPMLQQLLKQTETALESVDAIACSMGPGSFTGLRIGAATAKGLAFAAGKPLIAVPTLDALAYNVCNPCDDLIVPLMDARRGQVYTAFYTGAAETFRRLSPYEALPVDDLLPLLAAYHKTVVFLGDGAPVYRERIAGFGLDHRFAPAHLALQRAASVAALAVNFFGKGVSFPCDAPPDGIGSVYTPIASRDFVPFYLRQSQAEREYAKRAATAGRSAEDGGGES